MGSEEVCFVGQIALNWPIFKQKFYTDFLVVERNSVPTLKPVLEQFDFKTLITGNSNTKQVSDQLKLEADKLGINNHIVSQQGALKLVGRNRRNK